MTAAAHVSRRAASGWLVLAFAGMAVLSLALATFLGVVDLPPADVVAALTGHGSSEARSIILDIRLPRIVTGILAGIHFAIAGLLLQTITRNPLAEPSLMGISQGAMLAVSGFLVFTVYIHDPGSNTLQELPLSWLPAIGTVGGVLAGAFI